MENMFVVIAGTSVVIQADEALAFFLAPLKEFYQGFLNPKGPTTAEITLSYDQCATLRKFTALPTPLLHRRDARSTRIIRQVEERYPLEASVLIGADRDHQAAALRRLWTDGPPLSVAVATGIDERLHRTSAELAGLLSDALSGLERRIVPSLSVLPDEVPLVVLADHGFRENPSWGLGPDGRYAHGGTSLEECVVPVITAVC